MNKIILILAIITSTITALSAVDCANNNISFNKHCESKAYGRGHEKAMIIRRKGITIHNTDLNTLRDKCSKEWNPYISGEQYENTYMNACLLILGVKSK